MSDGTESNATLLKKSERNFIIPKGKGFPGQSNVWYADPVESQNLVDDLRAISHATILTTIYPKAFIKGYNHPNREICR